MKCPNTSRLAYGFLLRDHKGDEVAAFKAWLENGEEFPQQYLDEEAEYYNETGELDETAPKVLTVEVLEAKSKFLNKSYKVLSKKLKQMSKITNKSSQLEATIIDIQRTLRQMEKYSDDVALIEFLKAIDKLSKSTNKWLNDMESGKTQVTLDKLKTTKEFIHSVSLVEDFKKEFLDEYYDETIAPVVKSILHLNNLNKNKYADLSKNLIVDIWEPHYEAYRKMYARELEFKFNTSDLSKNLKGEELKKARKKYIDEQLIADEPYVKLQSRRHLRMLLNQFEDIDSMSNWLVNPKDINNATLTFAVEQLDYADWLTMNEVNKEIFNFKNQVNDFFNKVGKKNNPAEQYDLMTIQTDNGLYLVNKDNAPDKYNTIKTKYKDTAVEKLYDSLVELIEKRDKMLPKFARLGYKMPSINKGTMERIYSNGAWHTLKEGFHDIYKLRSNDIDYGDLNNRMNANKNAQSINVITNESGEERHNIPIHYRGVIDANDQSHDIVSMLLMDYHNANNFRHKMEASVILDLLKDNIAEADVIKRSSVKNLLKIEDNVIVTQKGINSNLYRSLESLIDHRVYGLGMSEEVNPKTAKMVNTVKRYTSNVSLMINWMSASANLLQGTAMNFIEAFGGEQGNYGLSNRLNASKKYNLDLPKIVADIGVEIPKSKTMLLMRLFDAHADWSGLNEPFLKNNRLKRMFNIGTLHGLQSITETSIQAIAMYSVLDNIKVLNEEGEYLTKDYKVTKDRNQAMSLDEAFSVVNGELVIDPRVSHTERTDDVTDGLFKISQLIKRVNRILYGNYASSNKSKLQRTILGSLITHMRGWLVSGIQYHWRGIGKNTKQIKWESVEEFRNKTLEELEKLSNEELLGLTTEQIKKLNANKLEKKRNAAIESKLSEKVNFYKSELERYELNQLYNLSYNKDTGNFEEGIYTSTIKFIKRAFQEYKVYKMATVSENWKKLNDHQRRNIVKTAVEALLILAALGMFKAFDDDDDYIYLAYISRRLYSELFTYANINEGIRTFRSPAISINTAENTVELLLQMLEPTEKYESGSRSGEYKIEHKFSKVVPIWSQLDRDTKDALNFLLK